MAGSGAELSTGIRQAGDLAVNAGRVRRHLRFPKRHREPWVTNR
jgi:hypothetical protein